MSDTEILREYAKAAMQGLLSAASETSAKTREEFEQKVVTASFRMAKAMLEAEKELKNERD